MSEVVRTFFIGYSKNGRRSRARVGALARVKVGVRVGVRVRARARVGRHPLAI